MSKKMMKRSLALGALMAFVITGSAMAETFSNDNVVGAEEPITGGAIYGTQYSTDSGYAEKTLIDGTNTIVKGIFTGISSKATGKNGYAYGGVIYNSEKELIVNGCTFKDNVIDSVKDNGYGGAIASVGGKLTINNSVFDNNGAKKAGASIYASGSQVTITGSTFKNHNSNANGVIYLSGKSELTLGDGNLFENNSVASINVQSGTSITLEGKNEFKNNTNQSILARGNVTFEKDSHTVLSGGTTQGIAGYATSKFNIKNGGVVEAQDGIYVQGTVNNEGLLAVGAGAYDYSTITNFEGTDGTLKFLDATQIDVKNNNTTNLTLAASGVANDAVKGNADELLKGFNFNGSENTKMVLEEGLTQGEKVVDLTFVEDAAGNVSVDKIEVISEAVNTKQDAVSDAGMTLKAHYRAHMNDMNKRMGELRMANGEAGVWTRMVRGESEYQGAKMQYNQYQLGYDEKLSVDKRWTVGAAVTFSEGDASYGTGSTEDKSTAFAIYGSKLNNDGTFVDLIARYARIESDLDDRNYGTGDYDANGYSVSAEFGKRIQQGNGLWIEPQVEFTYGSVDGAKVNFTNNFTANYDSMNSFVARAGFALGKDIKQGNVYARASYLYDFDGETETQFDGAKAISEDFGGGWWEVGVGANINLSKATYIYADVEKTFGGEVDTNWQWNLGVRYSF